MLNSLGIVMNSNMELCKYATLRIPACACIVCLLLPVWSYIFSLKHKIMSEYKQICFCIGIQLHNIYVWLHMIDNLLLNVENIILPSSIIYFMGPLKLSFPFRGGGGGKLKTGFQI